VLLVWPPAAAVHAPVAAGEADMANPRAFLHRRSDKILGLVVVVRLLKENVSLGNNAFAEVGALR
jgi:hypothetical protein